MSSRDIVATRKLNENKKAKLGRRGDTEIRNVGGEESHVNALEASLIDSYGKAGEDFTKAVGAGTINPYTGFKEYHPPPGWGQAHDESKHSRDVPPEIAAIDQMFLESPELEEFNEDTRDAHNQAIDRQNWYYDPANSKARGPASYDEFSALTDTERTDYLMQQFGHSKESIEKYTTGLDDKPFEFLESARDLQEKGLAMQDRQLKADFGFSQRALEGQRADAFRGLGRATGQQYQQASQAAMQAASQSGLATSGTIQAGLDQQMKQMFGDYSAGMQATQRDYTFGMDQAQSALGFGQEQVQLDRLTADLELATDKYEEGQRQMDKLYAEIAAI